MLTCLPLLIPVPLHVEAADLPVALCGRVSVRVPIDPVSCSLMLVGYPSFPRLALISASVGR
jgi:hypothetical protein